MNQEYLSFGEELRRRRLAAGLSLSRLAQIVHYSKSQLSKVERSIKAPSPELVRLCDTALRADGRLASLARPWATTRRQVLATGALIVPAVCLGWAPTAVDVDHTDIENAFTALFEHYRNLGQDCDPSSLLHPLVTQANAIQEFAKITGGHTSRRLLSLSSRYAEYAGWLAQETGNDLVALRWTRRAVDLADAAGDASFAAYGFVRHGLVTMYRGEATQTTQLAGRAQASSLPTRIRGLAAAREAQGHAIGADYDSAMRALDHAATLLSADGDSEQNVIGTRNLADQSEMTRGWCLYDLGRPGDAAWVIGQQVASIPRQATRSRVRYGVRLALAHAAAGDIDHACVLTAGLLDDIGKVRSATVAKDLRALARVLGRHPGNRDVRELSPRLGTALYGSSRR